MNVTNTMRNWCLALVSVALLIPAGATTAAPGGRQKLFYATSPDAGQVFPGDGVLIRILVDNTSTEPATINTVLVCDVPLAVDFYAGPLDDGGPTGNAVDYTGLLCGTGTVPGTGVILKDLTGLRRGEKATFFLTANVAGTCGTTTSLGNVRVYASTGNTTSFTPDFLATDSSGEVLPGQPPIVPVSIAMTSSCDGEIQCGDFLPLANVNNNLPFDPWEPGNAESRRMYFNSDGNACKLVPYDFTNALITDNVAVLKWPTSGDQKAAVFRNHVTGKLKTLSDLMSYPTSTRSSFAWEFDGAGDPVNVTDALMCLDSEYPRPYAKLSAALPATGLSYPYQFTVSFTGSGPVIPGVTDIDPLTPGDQNIDPAGWKQLPNNGVYFEFNIDAERIKGKVVARDNDAKTATIEITAATDRGLANTDPAAHLAGQYMLSLVMPIDTRSTTTVDGQANQANPHYNQVVRGCVISHGVRMYSPNPGSQASQYFEFLEYFDGDGWVRVGN